MEKKKSKLSILINGIIRENPVLVLVLGTCPTLAVTTSVSAAIGMGIAATLVLICSNVAISALRKVIPDTVRIPCYIVLIAGFVTIVQLVMQAYVYDLYQSLGVYLALIVVNCIILGRAEMFARENTVGASFLDAVGMGIGFTLALCAMATIREVFGAGTFFGIEIPFIKDRSVSILTMAPGGFFVFGCLIALINKITKGKGVKRKDFSCELCPSAAYCKKRALGTPDEKCDTQEKDLPEKN